MIKKTRKRGKVGSFMLYSPEEVLQYVTEEDVKFIRLVFCDVLGRQKNISILSSELSRAFAEGIAFDASAIGGFGGEVHSDLFLHPNPDTLALLPWRPEHGRVVRLLCDITYPDGTPFECDTRRILKDAVAAAEAKGLRFSFGAELEFYLFRLDQEGNPTKLPYDNAGYMDIAPDDKGENVRREICLTLESMGIRPEASHHEEGPGQNEIDFRFSDPISAADNAMTFRTVVKTIAARNGLCADFSPKPLPESAGNGYHINISVQDSRNRDLTGPLIAGILANIKDMTLFLNPTDNSYMRLGSRKAPKYLSWSTENRSQLIRIPAAKGEFRRVELRSPDPMANPYLAYALLIYAGLEGAEKDLPLPPKADFNLYTAPRAVLENFDQLPQSLKSAKSAAAQSRFLKTYLPESLIGYCCR